MVVDMDYKELMLERKKMIKVNYQKEDDLVLENEIKIGQCYILMRPTHGNTVSKLNAYANKLYLKVTNNDSWCFELSIMTTVTQEIWKCKIVDIDINVKKECSIE